MRIILKKDASGREVARVIETCIEMTGDSRLVKVEATDGQITINLLTVGHAMDPQAIRKLDGVEIIDEVTQLYCLAGGGESAKEGFSVNPVSIPFAGVSVGSDEFVVMAGPCAVEDEEQLISLALKLKSLGCTILRGGAFKPRTSPYCFQGLGIEGLEILRKVREQVGIAVVTEAMEPSTVEIVSEVADIVQIGSRNMQNYPLLKAVGKLNKPVLLKRGMSATLEEWLGAAEYVLCEGNQNVILCERGIRTFSRHSRHTLDIGVIPVLRERCKLPVIIDPSHATGAAGRVPSMAKAAMAAGSDGLLLEVHSSPEKALSDSFQSMPYDNFRELMQELRGIGEAIGKKVRHPVESN